MMYRCDDLIAGVVSGVLLCDVRFTARWSSVTVAAHRYDAFFFISLTCD